eukprot:1521930-Amphidinium_carterae.1
MAGSAVAPQPQLELNCRHGRTCTWPAILPGTPPKSTLQGQLAREVEKEHPQYLKLMAHVRTTPCFGTCHQGQQRCKASFAWLLSPICYG